MKVDKKTAWRGVNLNGEQHRGICWEKNFVQMISRVGFWTGAFSVQKPTLFCNRYGIKARGGSEF